MKVLSKSLHNFFGLFNVYGLTNAMCKRSVWQQISGLLVDIEGEVSVLGGDFNATLSPTDKRGGENSFGPVQKDFNDFVIENGLLEVKFKMGVFHLEK